MLTYRGTEIPVLVSVDDGYYSLNSKKFVKGVARASNIPFIVKDERNNIIALIYGSRGDIEEFLAENNLSQYNTVEAIPTTCSVQPNAYVTYYPDLESIPDAVVNQMCDFHFEGTSGMGKITRVIDGDSMNMLVQIHLESLSQGRRVKGPWGRESIKFPVLFEGPPPSIYIKLTVRLSGVDAAEHDTPQGVLAKVLMEDLFALSHNMVKYHILKPDKYGRTLVELYGGVNYTCHLNNILKEFEFGRLGHIAEEYRGEKKSEYMRSLPSAKDYPDLDRVVAKLRRRFRRQIGECL